MESHTLSQSKPIENEAFWRQHLNLQKSSGLSRTAYCRQHGLNYDRFGYWINKWNHGYSDKLLPVKFKTEINPISEVILCTLDLKNGRCLKIHDIQALAIILEKY